jgi:hypothetical protein
VLAYLGCVVAVITLAPFAFQRPGDVHLTLWDREGPWGGWFDVVTNVAMFTPLGFVAALVRTAGAAGADRGARWALGAGAAASAAIELAQLFEPERYPSPTDVATNAIGAWLGAWLCARCAAHLRADSPLVGRLALELPVMGLVYVSLPLLTLAGLTIPGDVDGGRALALPVLAGFGGVLLGTVQRRHLGPSGATGATTIAGAAALWFAVGAFPAAVTAGSAYAAGIVVAAAAAWLVGRRGVTGVRGIERRFETEALGRAAPWLVAYLVLVMVGDLVPGVWGRVAILRDLEHVAGFTVLGYLLAEAWGRREWRFRRSAWRVAGVATALAAGLAAALLAVGVLPVRAAVAGVVARVVAAAYGGWIYHLQRAHVRALVAARERTATRPEARTATGGARVADRVA